MAIHTQVACGISMFISNMSKAEILIHTYLKVSPAELSGGIYRIVLQQKSDGASIKEFSKQFPLCGVESRD